MSGIYPSKPLECRICASGYPLHLPQAMCANHQIPTVGLEPTSHTFYTAYHRTAQAGTSWISVWYFIYIQRRSLSIIIKRS